MRNAGKNLPRTNGFTLVELSIVLVILGLLIGGVLTGQSLIRAAELRSIGTQAQRYTAAVHTFRDKYSTLPGDMPNAQAYWGVAHSNPATCILTASTDSKTCNGDGSGTLNDNSAGANERFRFWQHLANAGLIEGNYNGVRGGGQKYAVTTANSPQGRLSGTAWWTYTVPSGDMFSTTRAFVGEYGNHFSMGGLLDDNVPIANVLKPEEGYNIDMKLDDGKPAMGRVMVYCYSGVSSCTDAVADDITALTANYSLNNTAVKSSLIFPRAY